MKRLMVSLLLVCIFCSFAIYPVAAETNFPADETVVLLSSLDEEQCESFLFDHGITIPEELSGIRVQELIACLEEDPNQEFGFEWPILVDFVEAVRAVVNSHYGLTAAPRSNPYPYPSYSLQYSTLHAWDSATMPNYNCYAYAIGRTTICQPGQFSGRSYDQHADIGVLAETIRADLSGDLGYACTKVSQHLPTSEKWTNIIAIRKDTTYDALGVNDYHVAKQSGSNWYHKVGGTAILKFNSTSIYTAVWTNERYNGTYLSPYVTYDSDLLLLYFKSAHGDTTYTKTGEHYHKGASHYIQYAYVCNDCGDYVRIGYTSVPCSGPPCSIIISTAISD